MDIPQFLIRELVPRTVAVNDAPVSSLDRNWGQSWQGSSALPARNLTERDKEVIAELQGQVKAKKAFPKYKFEAREALAKGARWDARTAKWVYPK